MTRTALLTALLISAGCGSKHATLIDGSRGLAIDPDTIEWTAAELDSEIASVEVRRGNWSSEHAIRLAGSEAPHVHQRHDLSVTLLSGRVRMHIGDQSFQMRPGDVATVPHGTRHWAQNMHDGVSIALAVFAPPYDGQDNTPSD